MKPVKHYEEAASYIADEVIEHTQQNENQFFTRTERIALAQVYATLAVASAIEDLQEKIHEQWLHGH